jgi:hypothetical protein
MTKVGHILVRAPHIKFSEHPLNGGKHGDDKHNLGIPRPLSTDAKKI